MDPPKKKRGRKPKVKEQPSEPPVKKKRGRKKKCEMNLNGEKNTGFIANLSTIDVSNNKIIISEKNIDDKNYENVDFGCGIVIKKKKKVENNDNIKQFHKTLLNETDECLIDPNKDIPLETKPKPKEKRVNSLQIFSKKTQPVPARKSFTEKITELYKRPKERKVRVLHKYGNDIRELLKKTDIQCWWCCHSFDTPPCFVPTKYDDLRDRFKITGNFCSWNCAKSYILDDNLGVHRSSDIHNFTRMLLKMGINYKIKMAPRKETLKCFGGILTIEEFRESAYFADQYVIQTSIIEYDDSINIRIK